MDHSLSFKSIFNATSANTTPSILIVGDLINKVQLIELFKRKHALVTVYENAEDAVLQLSNVNFHFVIVQDTFFGRLRQTIELGNNRIVGEKALATIMEKPQETFVWNGKSIRSFQIRSLKFAFAPTREPAQRQLVWNAILDNGGFVVDVLSDISTLDYYVLLGLPPHNHMQSVFNFLCGFQGIVLGERFADQASLTSGADMIQLLPAAALEPFHYYVQDSNKEFLVRSLGGKISSSLPEATVVILWAVQREPDTYFAINALTQILLDECWLEKVQNGNKIQPISAVFHVLHPLEYRSLWSLVKVAFMLNQTETDLKEAADLATLLTWTPTTNLREANVVVCNANLSVSNDVNPLAALITIHCMRDMAEKRHKATCNYWHKVMTSSTDNSHRLHSEKFHVHLPLEERAYIRQVIRALGGTESEPGRNTFIVWDKKYQPKKMEKLFSNGDIIQYRFILESWNQNVRPVDYKYTRDDINTSLRENAIPAKKKVKRSESFDLLANLTISSDTQTRPVRIESIDREPEPVKQRYAFEESPFVEENIALAGESIHQREIMETNGESEQNVEPNGESEQNVEPNGESEENVEPNGESEENVEPNGESEENVEPNRESEENVETNIANQHNSELNVESNDLGEQNDTNQVPIVESVANLSGESGSSNNVLSGLSSSCDTDSLQNRCDNVKINVMTFNESNPAFISIYNHMFDLLSAQKLVEKFPGETWSNKDFDPDLQEIPIGYGVIYSLVKLTGMIRNDPLISAYFRATGVQEGENWIKSANDSLCSLLSRLGFAAVMVENDLTSRSLLATTDDLNFFTIATFKYMNLDDGPSIINCTVNRNIGDMLNGRTIPGYLANPIAAVLCSSGCCCEKTFEIANSLEDIGPLVFHHIGRIPVTIHDTGFPMFINTMSDGSYEVRLNVNDNIIRINEISSERIGECLKISDTLISSSKPTLEFLCETCLPSEIAQYKSVVGEVNCTKCNLMSSVGKLLVLNLE